MALSRPRDSHDRNELTSTSGTTPATYSYDLNGSLIQKIEGPDTWTYAWTVENQLRRVLKNGVEQARFVYDPLGRRIGKTAGGLTTRWTYAGEEILREVRGGTTIKYVHGPGIDEPLAAVEGSTVTYFHADALGSIAKTTSAEGSVALSRRYDAWGNLELAETSGGYAFTGREWDPETGLYYYRARYYDPNPGRFLGEDPIRFKGGFNFYTYVWNNPTNWTDPTGLLTTSQASCLSAFTTLGAMGGFMAGGGFGAAATVGTGGIAFPTIPPAAAGGAAMGGTLGGAIGLIVCQIPPPTMCERRTREPEGPGPERENACWAAYVTCVKAAQAVGKGHLLCDLALKKCLDHPDIPVIFPDNF